MAAPQSKSLKDLTGKWVMNKTLSTNPDPGLALQGISWMIRKTIGAATVTLVINQYEGPPSPPADESGAAVTHIDIDQLLKGGLKGTSERRCLDFVAREHSDWLFGNVTGQSKWIAAADIEDAYLAQGWLEGDDEKAGPNGETHLLSHAVNSEAGWTADQIWGFKEINGERRYARNVVISKGDQRVELALYYDFLE